MLFRCQLLLKTPFLIGNGMIGSMRSLGLLFVSFIMLLSLNGCISTKIDRYTETDYPKNTSPYSVSIVDVRQVDRSYEVIGHVHVKASEVYTPTQMMHTFQKICKRMGGDAISDLSQKPLPQKFPAFFDYLNFYSTLWSAEIIIWKE